MKYFSYSTLAITCLFILLGGGYLYLTRESAPSSVVIEKSTTNTTSATRTYTNSFYGIAFEYPDTYYVTQQALTNPQAGAGITITLLEKGVTIPEFGDGPTSITLNIYDRALVEIPDENPLEVWIRSSPFSNFKTSTGATPTQATIASLNARSYTWDGLYPGTSVVTAKNKNVFIFSVTYNGQSDAMKQQDFAKILTTVRFLNQTATTTTAN